MLDRRRLLLGIDDTPTPRYGPGVEGCGSHRHPSPGPAGEKYLCGHVWVVLAALARHPTWDTIALPVQARRYSHAKDVPDLPPERPRPFRTKLELAAEQLRWLLPWLANAFRQRWLAVEGGCANKPFLRPAKQDGWVVTSRLRKDAALWSVPEVVASHQRGPGRPPIYGKQRTSLAKRAGQKRGGQQIQCVQYGATR